MQTVTKAILDYNRGRDPERLKMKLAAIRADAFGFFRGTCPLFYSTLKLDRSLVEGPSILACGDLHLQNFGSYKGDNRLVYFDLNDFDESCVAPVAFELVRFLTSIGVGASPLGISDKVASKLILRFIETYAANVISKKPRWVERPLATGPVKTLLQSLRGRHRRDLIMARTRRKAGKIRLIIDGKRTLAASKQEVSLIFRAPDDGPLHHQLPAVIELVCRCPDTRFILDHFGKPGIKAGLLDPWREHIRALAALPNVNCKLSGLITEADHAAWTIDQLRPYVDHVLATFDTSRVLFGGDWPVAKLAGAYPRWLDTARQLVSHVSPAGQDAIFAGNARRAYRLP